MSEQPPGQGWARGLGREQYPPSYAAGPSGQPSYQATQSQPPWETSWSGPAPGAGPSAQPSGPADPGSTAPGPAAPARATPGPAAPSRATPGRATPGPGSYGTRASAAREASAAPGAAADTAQTAGAGSGRGARQRPQLPLEESRNFLNALFDFGFTSFVTPKVVKVLYLLIVIVVGLSALAFAVTMLASNLVLGLIVLLIGAPLYFVVVTALYRITLEFFMVIFRMAEDIRALRERGEIR